MAVPDNYSFSLQDVVDEISGSQDDLVECFAEASASGFDPAYSGSKNSLRNFRKYDEVTTFIPTLTVSPLSQVVFSSGQITGFDVNSNTSWTVSSNQSWAFLLNNFGVGEGTFGVDIQPNNTGSQRIATITITTTASGVTNISRTVSIIQNT
ncbi:BACON domain-containing protein [Flagellimonas onchidii]|uniref:BACON domain-containing protein n=1 Tax=Flagellimonas onchidii TaxID=2562684 RepID=UPI0010A625F9|nr:BACON domain-containing protein [Allomuricauda onchidii]